ncbi:MAG: acetyl-CoA carboxylase biotin carboxylase subunit [Chitinivibrionales bacterium]
MFSKVLIANRGEIAVRIIRACRELGIKTVAVYSDADKKSMHVEMADEAHNIGPAPSSQSYLNYPELVHVAKLSGADAIHPGYGFLSENTFFAEVCEICKVVFIGPRPESISKMGEKSVARAMMADAGIPVAMGSKDAIEDHHAALKIADDVGFPLLIKASAGGGGKGMRVVYDKASLVDGMQAAQAEAKAAFGNEEVYIERYIEGARHIEIQILADTFGNVIHLGERECSIQRRHQKLIEESPSAALDPKLREKMGKAAIKAAKAVNYSSAGTVEFVIDAQGNFYFIEMNTRVQVEHPVTEMVTGVDIVKEQIRIAAGEPLTHSQKDIDLRGHAIECRVNAEDPENNFMPSPGKVHHILFPGGPGVRVDSHMFNGCSIPPHYDSLMAKIIVHAENRPAAIARMKRALTEFSIKGVDTTVPFHLKVLDNETFISGDYTTKFIDEQFLKKETASSRVR